MTTRKLTTKEVAELLDVTTGRVRQLAAELDLGEKFGRDWAFSDEDLERLRARQAKPGSGRRKRHPQDES